MRNLAIIPARSGSKGLKDKNIKELAGKPLLAYTIEAAIQSGIFDEIMVSTDSEEYAEVAKKWGAKVPFFRPKELATDTASSWDTVKHVLEEYKKDKIFFDVVTLLQPTSPLRNSTDIISGYELFEKNSASMIVSVSEVDHSPLWSNKLPDDKSMENFIKPEIENLGRQMLPQYYRINGALYMLKVNHLFGTENLYNKNTYALIMEKENSIDIDDQLDFDIANVIMARRNKTFS